MSAVRIPGALRASLGIGLQLRKIIHVGANMGQEVRLYENAGIEGYHVEAHPDYLKAVAELCAGTTRQTAVEACCDAQAGNTVEFKVASNKQSSSMLPLGRHALAYPHIVITDTIRLTTTTLDTLVEQGVLPGDADFLLIDVQGAEGRVLAGARKLLESGMLWGMQVEVSLDSLYEGGAIFEDVYAIYLKPNGYFLKTADFNRQGWANALFVKRWWRLPGETATPLQQTVQGQSNFNAGGGLDGRCSQSSMSQWSRPGEAERAVSDPPTGGFSFHTAREPDAWWMIEWNRPQKLDSLLCFNRIDAGEAVRNRIVGAIIEYSIDGKTWRTLHEVDTAFGGADGRPLRLPLDNVAARKVRIRQPRNEFLHLDHIEFVREQG